MAWEGTVMSSKCLSRRILRGFNRFGSKLRPSVVKKRQTDTIGKRFACSKGNSDFSPKVAEVGEATLSAEGKAALPGTGCVRPASQAGISSGFALLLNRDPG